MATKKKTTTPTSPVSKSTSKRPVKTAAKKSSPEKSSGKSPSSRSVKKEKGSAKTPEKMPARQTSDAASSPKARKTVQALKKPTKTPRTKTTPEKKGEKSKAGKTLKPGKSSATQTKSDGKPDSTVTKSSPQKTAEKVKSAISRTASQVKSLDSKRKILERHARSTKPTSFSFEDALRLADAAPKEEETGPSAKGTPTSPTQAATSPARSVADDFPVEKKVYGAASLADILGFNPSVEPAPTINEEDKIQKKYLKFFRLLQELREHVLSGLSFHTQETLKRSSKEDSGDLSSYGQHMADAGTDTFDRDFALSLVSNEQEALAEIDAALNRIRNGTYGICESTGKPIDKERLMAVPFARYSLETQIELEKNSRRVGQRGGAIFDTSGDEGATFLEDEDDE